MSGIAEILVNQGFTVTGSDMAESENTLHLRNLGAAIYIGHHEDNIKNAEVVVYSSAVKPDANPETSTAKKNGIPLIRRAEMLAELSRLNYCLAVAGTHGKTTTTSMTALVLIKAGIDPTVLVGGRLKDWGGTNARLGRGQWTVVEADEYDRSFLQLTPAISIINNIEADHLDIYTDFDDIKNTFTEFANKVPFYGFIALGLDDFGCKEILSRLNKKVITFGLNRHCNVRAVDIVYKETGSVFRVINDGTELGEIELNIPGQHNIKNALAAITVAIRLEVDFHIIAAALSEFKGVYRRFEKKGTYRGATVIDDYAHHPTEIKATLQAARNGHDKKVISIFQPHTYTRTKELYKEFGQSFDDSDLVIITGIYAAREEPIEGVSGNLIASAAADYGHKNVFYIEEESRIMELIDSNAGSGDYILTIGAGNIWRLAENLINRS